MRIAYYSPVPPQRSGIADYSALLLPALRKRLEVDVVRRRRRPALRRTDLAVYHIGNDPDSHGWIVDALRQRTGLVVLHELVVHHLVAGITLGRGDREGYLAAMQREHGPVGRMLAHGVVDGLVPPLWESRPEDFPLVTAILDHASGVVVHSRYVEDRVRATGYPGRVWQIPLAAWPAPAVEPEAELRGRRSFVVGCLGYLNPSKRVPQLLAAFAALRRSVPDALLVLAGGRSKGVDLAGEMARQGLRDGDDVVHLDYVPEHRLWSLMATCDVCVYLRYPTMGETSGSVVRTLSLGRPLAVSDVGWFSELPDEVAVKVPVGNGEVEVLAASLELLARDETLRERMATAARAYAGREHDLDRVADLHLAAIEETAGGELVLNAVLGEVAQAAGDVGLDPFGAEVQDLGARLKEVGLGH